MTPRRAPEGVGRIVPGGSDVVFQIHYHPTGKPERDQSSVGLFLAKTPVTKTMAGYSFCTDQIDIPPGAKRYTIILSTRLKADVQLYSVVPHAHYLCREFRFAATLPDGTIQPLLWITDWDIDWQDQYRYVRPVRLPKGTVVTFAAYFDNSEDNPRNPNKPPRGSATASRAATRCVPATSSSSPRIPKATRPIPGSRPSGCDSGSARSRPRSRCRSFRPA